MNFKKFDAVIVGGGIAGCSCALGLSKNNMNIAIIEPQLIFNRIHNNNLPRRVMAINARSVQILNELDIWTKIVDNEKINAFTKIDIWDQNSAAISFSSLEFSLPNLGFIVENQIIKSEFQKSLTKNKVISFNQDYISRINQHKQGFNIELDSGKKLFTPLLIGADGKNSFIRDFFKFDYNQKSYEHNSIIATIKTEIPHQNTAYQKFMNSGVLALLPLSDPNYCSIVWSENINKANKIMAMKNIEFQQILNKNFGRRLGLLKILSKRQMFSLVERHVHRYCRSGIVLIGDAAHIMHPLAGQGLNISLADIQILVKIITSAKINGRDYRHISTLSKFENLRKIENTIMIKSINFFKRLFCNSSVLSKNSRYLACKIINNSKLLKQFFIHQASGN